MKRSVLVLLAIVAVATAQAGEPWADKPPAQWSEEETLELLTDSPWGKTVSLLQPTGRLLAVFWDPNLRREVKAVYQEGPGMPRKVFDQRPIRVEPEVVPAEYVVRWDSAEIIQQALHRIKGISSFQAAQQAAPKEISADHYVLTVRVTKPPAESPLEALNRALVKDEQGRPYRDRAAQVSDLFAGWSEEELKARAELRTSEKDKLKPERAVRHGVGTGEGITFYFPRQQDGQATLSSSTDWAEFVFEGRKGNELKVKFQPDRMQLNGQPDY